MRTIKVTFDNGDSIITNINSTESEIKEYYIGNIFNIGTYEDCLVKAVSVKFLE